MNFIVKKTFKDPIPLENDKLPHYLYATYRVLWEHASDKRIANELKKINREFLKRIRTFSWNKALIHKDEKEKLSISAAIPSFMIDRLLQVMNIDFLRSNFSFMNGIGSKIEVTVRINNLSRRGRVLDLPQRIEDRFIKNNIKYRKDIDIPELYWIPLSQKSGIIVDSSYQKGNLIFQDKASAAVVQVLSPRQEDKIVDMCAAPGIKTSLLAQYMNNEGYILAGEFLNTRTKIMKKLFSHLKVLNVHIINTDSIVFPIRFQNYFDCILLDAPCTGSGTFLSNPELKWRQNEKFLHQNVVLQKKLFESALKLLKPNGILVYSTCSFYPEEGELQILNYRDQLEPLDLPKWFSPSYEIKNKLIKGTGRLYPSVHHTQAFFIGKFKKKG
ncbi:MAG: RsmB/NOP family class I SAM-dependent RNA methyltransferase [Candidatus Lokiarchaeota archaeon]|nr:RsmB/NOP family class I SAM-dependent RNA methyltransferase [Candidatus Lokiarchaeota archaeon]